MKKEASEKMKKIIQEDFERFNYERKCQEALKKLLLERGYPDTSFFSPLYHDPIQCDLIVQNPNTNEPLFCFEIKSKKALEEYGYHYYQTHKPKIQNVLFYFVYIDENETLKLVRMFPNISLGKFKARLKDEYSSILPFYEDAIKQQISQEKKEKQKKIKQKKDTFSIWCYIVTFILIILFILELCGVFKWSTERIIVLSIIILLPLLPLFAEIKIGDYTFKRKKQD